VAELIPNGPVATINAGWRERETETDELNVVLGGRMVNLELYRRWQQLSDDDLEYAEAERRLFGRLEDLRAAYQLRLRHGLAAVRAVAQRMADSPIRTAAVADAVAGVRALDAWHVDRSTELRAAFSGEVRLGERASIGHHRQQVSQLVDASAGLVITAAMSACCCTCYTCSAWPQHLQLLAARLVPYPGLLLDDGVRLDLVDQAGLPAGAVLLAAAT
jgi:hypothetical protein